MKRETEKFLEKAARAIRAAEILLEADDPDLAAVSEREGAVVASSPPWREVAGLAMTMARSMPGDATGREPRMPERSPTLASLDREGRAALERRLLERQGRRCFICDETIDHVLHELEIESSAAGVAPGTCPSDRLRRSSRSLQSHLQS